MVKKKEVHNLNLLNAYVYVICYRVVNLRLPYPIVAPVRCVLYNFIFSAISAKRSGESCNLGLRKSTSASLFIGIR